MRSPVIQADSSDAQGIARASWMLGGFPGRQTLSVVAEGITTPTVVTAEAEPTGVHELVVLRLGLFDEGPPGGLRDQRDDLAVISPDHQARTSLMAANASAGVCGTVNV